MLERWHTYWGWLFYGLLVAATGLAAADVDSVARWQRSTFARVRS